MVASDVTQAVETTTLGFRVEILDPAQLPLGPSRPERLKILVASLLIGPLLGGAVAFVGETTDATLRSLDDFRRLAPEPILCVTPLLSSLAPRPRGIRRYWVPAALASVVLLTASYFVARKTVLHDLALEKPVQVVKPEQVVSP